MLEGLLAMLKVVLATLEGVLALLEVVHALICKWGGMSIGPDVKSNNLGDQSGIKITRRVPLP